MPLLANKNTSIKVVSKTEENRPTQLTSNSGKPRDSGIIRVSKTITEKGNDMHLRDLKKKPISDPTHVEIEETAGSIEIYIMKTKIMMQIGPGIVIQS